MKATSAAQGQAEQVSQEPAPAVEASPPAPAVEAVAPAEQAAQVPAQEVGQVRAVEAEEVGAEEVAKEESEKEEDDSADKTVDESVHKCPDCGFLALLNVSSLREHEHCDVAWDCVVCNEEDMTASELIEHHRDKHKEVPWLSDSESEIELNKA